jgi:putative exosortase-associated protein (TIGR04073 family)
MAIVMTAAFAAGAFCADCGSPKTKPCGRAGTSVRPDPCSEKATPGFCNSDAWRKLGRGLANMVTFPLELLNQVSRTNISDGPMAAVTWGLVKGVGMTGFRALVGVYETVTFPFPCPKDYKPILTEPEFFLEEQIC